MKLAAQAVGADRPWALVTMDSSLPPLVAEVERGSHPHPWGEGHFRDSIAAGYWCQLLVTPALPGDPPAWDDAPRLADGRLLLAYLVAMPGYRETHLLNITTVPLHRRQGCARLLLEALRAWSRLQGAEFLWLEVRAGNQGARALYQDLGFAQAGLRRGYYPADGGQREDAVVMSLALLPADPATAADTEAQA
ncbi:GNAT family N-acetyltransferase [Malikia sp.]|uniref:GNAT family N-acetyltransferase n=1 Tax=Malikia sp. TaxID=2070706 RepID=UPI002621241E|nr:GNAT family N-acetyltransferase [Malikia sp.]MDD2728915.1 GNAT family N-acetyltransferase [Malikia sp.]